MRVGFVTNLLWDRYGPFWVGLLEAAGAEVRRPDPERVRKVWDDPRLDVVAGTAFRRAVAEALALAGCDRIVAPALNPGYEGSRGSAQDPFVARFPEALAQAVPGLPPVVAVPADLEAPGLAPLAIDTLQMVAPGPAAVRRVWQTHRASARPPRPPGGMPVAPPSTDVVALVGQPWSLNEGVERALQGPGELVVSAARFPPRALREEGTRIEAGLAPTDAEALGAVRRFARSGTVTRVRMVVDPASGADAWLARRAQAWVRRPFETVPPPDLGAHEDAAASTAYPED